MNVETGGWEIYQLFNALKLHFTGKYDFIKYNGKSSVSKESFLNNKAKYSFYRLSRKYSVEEAKEYFISNFVERDIKWIGDMLTDEAETCYMDWKKRKQSMTYQFQTDIDHLFDTYEPEMMLKVTPGDYPKLLIEVMQGSIKVETLVIMNDLMNFFPMWEKKVDDDVIFPTLIRRYKKYQPFLKYDKIKMKSILKEKLSEISSESV